MFSFARKTFRNRKPAAAYPGAKRPTEIEMKNMSKKASSEKKKASSEKKKASSEKKQRGGYRRTVRRSRA